MYVQNICTKANTHFSLTNKNKKLQLHLPRQKTELLTVPQSPQYVPPHPPVLTHYLISTANYYSDFYHSNTPAFLYSLASIHP